MPFPRYLPIAAVGALLLAAPAAEAKKLRSSATYMTTIKAEMTESWSHREYSNRVCSPPDSMCSREELGEGNASATVKTRRPFPAMLIKGFQGRPPTINLGSDGIPVTINWLRTGQASVTYAGHWDAANPDTVEETTDCGPRTEKTFASIGWDFEQPYHLMLQAGSEPLREECPSGPPSALDWERDELPYLGDIAVKVGKAKFLGTKQFTVRGTRTWKGTLPGMNRTDPEDTFIEHGEKTVTWSWEATFRMKTKKRKK